MPDQIENLIKLAYAGWKKDESKKLKTPHPNPKLLAAFLEKPLPAKDDRTIKLHLIMCDNCSEALAAQLVIEIDVTQEVPPELIKWAKGLPVYRHDSRALIRILRLKKKILSKLATQKFISVLLRHLQLKNLLINYR
jgi:hypothetical protein